MINPGEAAPKFMTAVEFARSQGWDRSQVAHLKKTGRLVMEGRNIDVAASLARIAETADPDKAYTAERHAKARAAKGKKVAATPAAQVVADAQISTGDSPVAEPYWKIKARRETAMAAMAELELEKVRGQLIERDRVEAAAYATSRMLRDAILGIPSRISAELAALTDPFEVEMFLRRELSQVLTSMAKASEDDLKQALVEH